MDVARVIAKNTAGLKFENIPDEAVKVAKERILDTLGVAVAVDVHVTVAVGVAVKVAVGAPAVRVSDTAVPTTLAVADAVRLAVAVTAMVAELVTVAVAVGEAVAVAVGDGVNDGEGVKVLVAGTNWVGVAGSVPMGPPGVKAGVKEAGGKTNWAVVACDEGWVGVAGRAVGEPTLGFGKVRAKKPAQ